MPDAPNLLQLLKHCATMQTCSSGRGEVRQRAQNGLNAPPLSVFTAIWLYLHSVCQLFNNRYTPFWSICQLTCMHLHE